MIYVHLQSGHVVRSQLLMEHVRQIDAAAYRGDKAAVRELLADSDLRKAVGTTDYDRWQQAVVRQYDEWLSGNTFSSTDALIERLRYEGLLAIVEM